MKPRIPASLLLILLTLAACSARGTVSATLTPIASVVSGSAATIPPTPTLTHPPTAAPSPTTEQATCPAPEPTTVEVKQTCITIEDSLPADLRPGGALLLTNDGALQSIYHLDLMSWRRSPIPDSYYYGGRYFSYYNNMAALSPDGKWLAYLEIGLDARGMWKNRTLKVNNAEGRYLDMSYWTLNWQDIVGWQDNQHLTLAAPGFGGYIRLNPFTTEYEILQITLPDLKPDLFEYYPMGLNPSPDLAHWVYAATQTDPGWRLFAVGDQGKLIRGNFGYNGDPSWSPNGHYFTLMENYSHAEGQASTGRLLSVQLDGKMTPLTNPLGIKPVLSWSPDGRSLAGWLQLDPKAQYPNDPNHLVIIDMEKPMLIDLCFENQKDKYGYIHNTPPVWSPNGRFLAVAVSRMGKDRWGYERISWDTALIDLLTNRGYRLVENNYPWVWMGKAQ